MTEIKEVVLSIEHLRETHTDSKQEFILFMYLLERLQRALWGVWVKNPLGDVIRAKITLGDIARVILGSVCKRTRHELQIRVAVSKKKKIERRSFWSWASAVLHCGKQRVINECISERRELSHHCLNHFSRLEPLRLMMHKRLQGWKKKIKFSVWILKRGPRCFSLSGSTLHFLLFFNQKTKQKGNWRWKMELSTGQNDWSEARGRLRRRKHCQPNAFGRRKESKSQKSGNVFVTHV